MNTGVWNMASGLSPSPSPGMTLLSSLYSARSGKNAGHPVSGQDRAAVPMLRWTAATISLGRTGFIRVSWVSARPPGMWNR